MRDQGKSYNRMIFFVLAAAFALSLPVFASTIEMYYSLGQEYMKNGNFDMAALSFKKVVELSPDWAEAHNALGQAYYQLLQFKNAVIEFDKAVKLKPDYTEAKINRIRTMRSIARYEPIKSVKLTLWHKYAIAGGVVAALAVISLLVASYLN